ncbi:MAG: flagellar filament outer layer protein FlaA [Treponema sp.]|nr:flagellar filament outer layer protein FlaA [Spirochaetia bacterium]MDD7579826.1 flagellar filament outer layer protein FlaA [Treponema sp.]MCI7441112.1 flagellar filament outer layer protein FlaA [Spirochaetia bacterium]MDY3758200.1 flagellar filament outer layer protein FlaA [Treponema sp.]MDY4129724.1 flagellar filament outer layer protein FlaA [Treponema sp.]
MKKTLFLTVAAMVLASTFASAKESMLIDFTQLKADAVADENGNPTENGRTVMDYSVAAGATFTGEQKSLMKTSLALTSWEVVLNSSAKNPTSVGLSQVVAAPVKESADVPFAGKEVMGVRVKFPTWANNANAKIVPAFDIPAYEPLADLDENGERKQPTDEQKGKYLFDDGYGVVRNVGTLKSIAVTTMGMNFPHQLYVLLTDNDNVTRRYLMGELFFDGWKTLQWNNPDYISEVRTREIRVYPIYPRGIPLVKFAGFQVCRDANHIGDDFIGYFKDVKIIYDLAVLTSDRDIDDEDLWGIISKKEAERQAGEMARFGNKQVNRYLEKSKMATESEFTTSLSADSNSNAQQTDAAK